MDKPIYFNITLNVDEMFESEWKKFLKSELIPKLKSKQYITELKLMSILVAEEMGGKSFALMIKTDGKVSPEYVFDHDVAEFNSVLSQKFKDKVLTFTTFLKEEFVVN